MENQVKKPMNGTINVLKFIMAVFIFLMHCSVFFSDKYFQGSYIFVEWFYVLMGFTLAKTIINLPRDGEVLINSTKIVYKRMAKIYPFYLASCIVALVIKLYFKEIVIASTWDINTIVHEILLLQMTTIIVNPLTGTAWFLSSMLICLIILVPIFVKLREKIYPIAIVVATLIYYYIYKKSGYLWRPIELLITYKGNLRAMAAILLGIFGYAISNRVSKVVNDIRYTNAMRVGMAILYLASFAYIMKVDDSPVYFMFPYIFMILISIGMSIDSPLIKDSKLTRLLGDMSMVLFMNHYYVAEVIQFKRPYMSIPLKYLYSTIGSLAISIFIYVVITYLMNLKKTHSAK